MPNWFSNIGPTTEQWNRLLWFLAIVFLLAIIGVGTLVFIAIRFMCGLFAQPA